MDDFSLLLRSISIFHNAASSAAPLIGLAQAESVSERVERAAEVFRAVADFGCDTTGEWLTALVVSDDNALSRAAAKGGLISKRMKLQAEKELLIFKRLSLLGPNDFMTDNTREFFPMFGFGGFSVTVNSLLGAWEKSGCGVFSKGSCFVYDGEKDAFIPTVQDTVRLSDLKNYDEEKSEIVKNTENFIAGLPAFNTLLYGDRGTGKSTTVRALSYEYRGKLKMIELKRGDVSRLRNVYETLDGYKQKFIIFIDDLSFDETDASVDGFKAALEGSFGARDNVLLYCTSNRRHLVKENDREYKNFNDETQAELALFDRFGLVVTYVNPDKAEFLDIFKQILRARSIKWRDEYAQIAELAALKKGGRSPRAAKQIADLIESTYALGKKDR